MKILIATPLYPPQVGGPAKYAKALQSEFSKEGHEVMVVSFSEVRHLPPLVRHSAYFLKIVRAIRNTAFILTLDTWSVGLPALVAAKLWGVPLIARVGGDFLWESYVEDTGKLLPFSHFYRQMPRLPVKQTILYYGTRFFAQGAAKLLFNSQWQKDAWQKTYDISPSKTGILENEYGGSEGVHKAEGRVFIAAGRNIKLKNMPRLEEAFAAVQRNHPDIVLDTRVLPPQEHRERLARAYAIVVPSISEMNPNTIWEGISLGKPFICTNDTGARERLEGLGMFIDTQSREELERSLERMLDAKVYKGYIERIRAFPYTHSWSQIAAEILTAIKR